MNEKAVAPVKKDKFIDIDGVITHFPITKRFVIGLVAAIAVYLILAFGTDLSAYGEQASLGLAGFVSIIVLMVFSGMQLHVCAFILIQMGIFMGIWGWGDVQSALGGSQFYMMLGMIIVASGAEFTPVGRRMAYFALKILGQKPTTLCFAVGLVTAIMSAFVSNIATIILMSSIVNTLLETMGEKPGESHIGRAMMPLIILGSMIGGCALISGSPFGNGFSLGLVTSGMRELGLIGETDMAVTYAQWAFFGIITFILTVPVSCIIYIKMFKVKNEGQNLPPKSYYEEKMAELGPMAASEFRWIIMIVTMVALMISGKNTSQMAMLFGGIALLPGIGVTPYDQFQTKIPLHTLLPMGMVPIMSKFITDTGVVNWIADKLIPIMQGLKSPMVFSLITCYIMCIGYNFLTNAGSAFNAAYLTIITPITVALGFNPSVVLLPALFAASWFWIMGMNAICMLNKGYGYWENGDIFAPGCVSSAWCCLVAPIVCVGLCGVIGMSPYL